MRFTLALALVASLSVAAYAAEVTLLPNPSPSPPSTPPRTVTQLPHLPHTQHSLTLAFASTAA